LLWQVCQIPDFRQLQLDDHFKLLRAVFLQLTGPRGRLEKDWIARHLERLSELQGDIDTLLARMAFIRTWTYITHHARWLDDAQAWQEQARALEDDLSDALHASWWPDSSMPAAGAGAAVSSSRRVRGATAPRHGPVAPPENPRIFGPSGNGKSGSMSWWKPPTTASAWATMGRSSAMGRCLARMSRARTGCVPRSS
jgi:ATP-dependent RNA helicase SUPV3L1/SUV3